MILFLFLSNRYEKSTPGIYNISLSAGYYNISLIGAQGGQACHNGEIASNFDGGHGAIIKGILHLTAIETYSITVGESPTPTCVGRLNYGGRYGEGGNSGRDNEFFGHPDPSGGGGGYSSFEKNETKINFLIPIAIAGGGSGASAFTNGASAGGIYFTFKISPNRTEIQCKNIDKCLNRDRRGGNGEDSIYFPGSGGGGGNRGGYGGYAASDDVYAWQSVAKGGSSNFHRFYFVGEPEIIVGITNGATGHGSVTIEPLVICQDNCYDCDFNNHSCIQCMDGFHLYKGSCISSCNQTSSPTYLDTDDNTCKPCLSRCIKCDNGSQCTQTKEDLCLRACSFFSDRRIFRIH